MSAYFRQAQVVMEEFTELMPTTPSVEKTIRVTCEDVFSSYACWASI